MISNTSYIIRQVSGLWKSENKSKTFVFELCDMQTKLKVIYGTYILVNYSHEM